LEYVDELDPGVHVGADLVGRDRKKIRIVRIEPALGLQA
jgi:hypothetical protein